MTQANYDFSNFTFRCSSLGDLLTPARGKSNLEKYNTAKDTYDKKLAEYEATVNKSTKTADNILKAAIKAQEEMYRLEPIKDEPHLSQKCKTKLAEIFTTATTGRKKILTAKYLEKGLLLEEDAITAYSMLTKTMFRKNKTRRYNEFIEGEIDFRDPETVYDTKVSWDIFSFDANAFKVINPTYEWQGDGYMWLENVKKFKLIYALIDTPAHMVASEKRKLIFEMFGTEANMLNAPKETLDAYQEGCADIEKNHTYNDLPIERKIQTFDTEYREERIELIKSSVPQWRKYLNNFTNIKQEDDDTED